MNQCLPFSITDNEIYSAVNAISALKVDGPDGLSAGLFHGCWE